LDEATYSWSGDHADTEDLMKRFGRGRQVAWMHRAELRKEIQKGGTPTATGRQPPGKGAQKRLKALTKYIDASKVAMNALNDMMDAQEDIEDSV
jgi:hypothetical protein